MPVRKTLRWQDMDHSDEPLLDYVVGAKTSQQRGPIPEFLAKKRAERAPKTFEWYRDSLMQLWGFLEARGLTAVGQFDEHAVNLFRIELRDRGVSENTLSNRLRAVKAFARWMGVRGWTEGNVLADLRVPQSTKPRFELIADDARARLFDLYSPDTFLGSRNLAILAVLSDAGLRREEAINLLLANVDLNGQVLKVYSDKTEEWRYVPLTDEATALLRNHLKWRARFFNQPSRPRVAGDQSHRHHVPRSQPNGNVFVTCEGKPLTPHGLSLIFLRASKRLGCRIHPHLFRHDWLTRKALDGENPSVVKRWAGHRSYVMTDYYFGVAEEMLGAIKPKHSVLSAIPLPGVRRRGRPPKAAGA